MTFKTKLQKPRLCIVAGLLAAVAVRVWLYHPAGQGDSLRFLDQAGSIVAGHGFSYHGVPCVYLPPGYPLFISALWLINRSTAIVRVAQLLISILSCWITYRAARPYSERAAILALWVMALNPFIAHRAAYLMSETLILLFVSIFAWLLSRFDRNSVSPFHCIAIGVMAAVLVLTGPATVFLSAAGVFAAVLTQWRRPKRALLIVAAACITIFPWQLHCLWAVGKPIPTVYDAGRFRTVASGRSEWLRTWLIWPDEFSILWSHKNFRHFDDAPLRAFENASERETLRTLFLDHHAGKLQSQQFDQVLGEIASRRRKAAPFRTYIFYPLARCATAWCEADCLLFWWQQMPGGPLVPIETLWSDGTESDSVEEAALGGNLWAHSRILIISTLIYLIHAVTITIIGITVLRGLKIRRIVPYAILFGVLAYTFAGAVTAKHESRRSLVFYPALLVLAATTHPVDRRERRRRQNNASIDSMPATVVDVNEAGLDASRQNGNVSNFRAD